MNTYSIQNILVAVDFSETSLNAMETAVALAKKHKAALHLFHVSETYPGEAESCYYSSAEANADILSAIAGAISHNHDLVPNVIEVEGNVTESIIKVCLQISANLIVMGTHGASGYRDGFIGSNAYNVIKFSGCPVVTVPPLRKVTAFKKVLFPIRPVSGALNCINTLSKFLPSSAAIDVLGLLYQKMEVDTGMLDKIIGEIKSQMKPTVKTNSFWGSYPSITDSILHHTQQTKPDLLVITSTLDVAAKPNYIGPHAQKIIHSAKVPVLHIKRVSISAFA